MRVLIAAVGKAGRGAEADLCARYLDRAAKAGGALGVSRIELVERVESRAATAPERKAQEARDLLSLVPPGGLVVALDERGEALPSKVFAERVARLRDQGAPALCFLIGGPDGHGEAVLSAARLTYALGPATWPHLLARALLLEQIYRAMTIWGGHPYHRE